MLYTLAMNRYDTRARLVFHFAREEGEKLGHAAIGPEHLLLGLLRAGGTASRVLGCVGVTLDESRRLARLTRQGAGSNDEPAVTSRTHGVMERAGLEATRLGSKRICTSTSCSPSSAKVTVRPTAF